MVLDACRECKCLKLRLGTAAQSLEARSITGHTVVIRACFGAKLVFEASVVEVDKRERKGKKSSIKEDKTKG